MKTLIPARSLKALDQEVMGQSYSGSYLPVMANMQYWDGVGVAPQTALNYIAVYQCVRVLANTFAMLPLKVYRRLGDSAKEPAFDHPLYDVLHLRPNPDMTSFVWRKIVMTHLATWGNHYSEKVYDRAGRLQLWPIRPDRIEPRYDGDGNRVYDYIGSYGQRKRLDTGSIFHMQGQTSNGLLGSSPVAELRRTLSLANSAQSYATSVFDNGARPGVVLSHPRNLSTPAIDRLAGQMDALRGAKNAGKTVVLEEGMTVTPVGFPPEDAQFLETQLMQHRLLYGAYGIPPHKVGDLERATFSNIEHQSIEFIQDGAMPWFVNAEQEIAVQLISEPDIFAEFLIEGYLRGDSKSEAETLKIMRDEGIINGDEWRAKKNMNPLPDGLGRTYWRPVNYGIAEEETDEESEVEPAELSSPPVLTAVKTASVEVRCPSCNKYHGRTTGTWEGECTRCKAAFTKTAGPLLSVVEEQRFEYDAEDRVVAIVEGNERQQLAYDAKGLLVEVS